MQLELGITEYVRNVDGDILNTAFENTVRSINKCPETGGGHCEPSCNFLYFNHQGHKDFLITLCVQQYGASSRIPVVH
jgi:hypothetical protein